MIFFRCTLKDMNLLIVHNKTCSSSGVLHKTSRYDMLESFSCLWTHHNTTLDDIIQDRFQRLPPARGGTAQKKIINLANWSQLIHPGPASSLTKVFLVSSQSCVSTLTHYSSELLLPGHQGLWMIWQRTWSWQTTTTTYRTFVRELCLIRMTHSM